MSSQHRAIDYLSASLPVNMGDWWFDVATTEHFWVRRRFEVLKKLADSTLRSAKCVAEIGCGNGLLQREIEDHYRISVSGFDLNEVALQKNVSRHSPLYCYDIHQRNPEFRARFDVLLLFDVLEHIDDESEFLQSLKFHLLESGAILVNVPAHQFFFSDYDRAAGHIRRYSRTQLVKVADRNGLKVRYFTYWGLPLVPLLLARKAMRIERTNGQVGFDARGHAMSQLLSLTARCEPIPQRFLGTSVMALLEHQT